VVWATTAGCPCRDVSDRGKHSFSEGSWEMCVSVLKRGTVVSSLGTELSHHHSSQLLNAFCSLYLELRTLDALYLIHTRFRDEAIRRQRSEVIYLRLHTYCMVGWGVGEWLTITLPLT
jgi:hypothetical protein